MASHIKKIFFTPREIRDDYWSYVVRSNHKILTLLSLLSIAAQLFNIYRVLVGSDVKLATLNNRIYFSFYSSMLAGCVLYLLIGFFLKKKVKALGYVQGAAMTFWLIWSIGLNYYDIYRGSSYANGIFVTGLLGCAVCIQMVPWFAILNFIAATVAFHAMTMFAFDFSFMWNCILSLMIGILISYARFRHTVSSILSQQEITEINGKLMEEKEKLDLSLQKYKYILGQTNNIIFDWDTESDVAEFSGSWTQNFDYPSRIPEFRQWLRESPIMSQEQREKLMNQVRQSMTAGNQLETEVSLHDKNGIYSWFLLHFIFFTDSDGKIRSGLGYLTDINRHKAEVLQLKSRAKSDPLTGLMNRSAMIEYMHARLDGLGPSDMLVMVILDVDDFKHVNDTFGHPCGDKVLIEIGQMLRRRFREGDGIGRIGGDEFMVIFTLKRNMPAVKKKLEKLVREVEPVEWGSDRICVSISAGAAIYGGETFEGLYKKADHALYTTKQKNKGGYTIDG